MGGSRRCNGATQHATAARGARCEWGNARALADTTGTTGTTRCCAAAAPEGRASSACGKRLSVADAVADAVKATRQVSAEAAVDAASGGNKRSPQGPSGPTNDHERMTRMCYWRSGTSWERAEDAVAEPAAAVASSAHGEQLTASSARLQRRPHSERSAVIKCRCRSVGCTRKERAVWETCKVWLATEGQKARRRCWAGRWRALPVCCLVSVWR